MYQIDLSKDLVTFMLNNMDALCKNPGNLRKESATVYVVDKLVDFTPH